MREETDFTREALAMLIDREGPDEESEEPDTAPDSL